MGAHMTSTPEQDDPAMLGWPPTLPIEVALGEIPLREIFASYNLDKTDYLRLKNTPGFMAQVAQYRDALRQDGMNFKLKAQLQAEELLKASWQMIHAPDHEVPPNVKADLIKSTIKWAGLDASANKAAQVGVNAPALQINIQFNGGVGARPVETKTIEAA